MLAKKNIQISRSKQEHGAERGIALILTIIILTNLLMITLIVSDVILRIGKSSQQISESEVAYYAAESSVEEAMYKIVKEKDASSLGTSASPTTGNLEEVDANWERYVEPVYETLVTCVDDDNKITYYQVSSFGELAAAIGSQIFTNSISCIYAFSFSEHLIRQDNQLVALLAPGKSFELDLDITVSDVNYYPEYLKVNWSKPTIPGKQAGDSIFDGQLIILNGNQQESHSTLTPSGSGVTVPASGSFGTSPDYRLRAINNDSSDYVIFQFNPYGGENNKYLPVAIKVKAKGYYSSTKKKERKVEAEKRNWQIY